MLRLIVLFAVLIGLAACDERAVECGPGTTEVQGTCMLSESAFQAHCGLGTELHWTLGCRPALPEAQCSDNTVGVVADNGHTICECNAAGRL